MNTFTSDDGKKYLKSLLSEGPVEVVFKKQDGTERTMKCTLKESLTKTYEKKTDKIKAVSEDVLPVYDLEKEGWRSFRYDSIVSVAFGTV